MALLTRLNTICKSYSTLSVRNINCFCVNVNNFSKTIESKSFKSARQILQQNRNLSIFPIFKRQSVQKLKEQDEIPDEYHLIYRNTMNNYLLMAQIFSTVCAGIVCLAAVVMYQTDFAVTTININTKESPGAVENEFYVYMTAFLGFCTLLQFFIARMPLRIYYLPQQKNYIMVFYRSVPFSTRRITYGLKDIIKLEERGIMPWKDSTYEIENVQKVILLENYFRRPADLNIMLGYQKCNEDK